MIALFIILRMQPRKMPWWLKIVVVFPPHWTPWVRTNSVIYTAKRGKQHSRPILQSKELFPNWTAWSPITLTNKCLGLNQPSLRFWMDLFLCLQFPRSDAKSHSQTQIESHLKLALHGLEATQHQVQELVTVVKDQSRQIERQSQQIERQSGQIKRLMSKDKKRSEKKERRMSRVQDQPPQRERQEPIKRPRTLSSSTDENEKY